jgi:hypothetical protein
MMRLALGKSLMIYLLVLCSIWAAEFGGIGGGKVRDRRETKPGVFHQLEGCC